MSETMNKKKIVFNSSVSVRTAMSMRVFSQSYFRKVLEFSLNLDPDLAGKEGTFLFLRMKKALEHKLCSFKSCGVVQAIQIRRNIGVPDPRQLQKDAGWLHWKCEIGVGWIWFMAGWDLGRTYGLCPLGVYC